MYFWKVSFSVLAVCGSADLALGYGKAYGGGPAVQINSTTVQGLYTDTTSDNGELVAQYLGIPYAPQPERFSPAKPYILTQKTLDARNWGPTCIQNLGTLGGAFQSGQPPVESEDCLSLNVWTPLSNPHKSAQLPVLFWIYGGAYQFGTSNFSTYNGTVLSSHDQVIVTINYRTNVFGFPSGTQVPVDQTNLGLLDQRLALAWVRKNIESFGGDPKRITLFGQSAGSFSVDSFILQGPAQNPPFRAAILESGVLLPPRGQTRGVAFNQLAYGVGCNQANGTAAQLECLRKVPATTIKAVEGSLGLSFAVIEDNITVYTDAYARRLSGKVAKVPIIIGSTADEGTVFTYSQTNFSTYVASLSPLLGAILPTLRELYPVPSVYATDSAAIAALFRDVVFTCPISITATLTALYTAPTYRYLYNATFPNTEILPSFGAYHASELPLVFGTYSNVNVTAQQVALSYNLQSIWTGFARNPYRGPWPKLGSFENDLAYIGVNGSSGVTMLSRKPVDRVCNLFWDAIEAPGKDLSAVTFF